MRTRPLSTIALALAVCALAAFSPARAAPYSAELEILKGHVLPKDWNDAPKELHLPKNWVDWMDTLLLETKATNHERGACIAYGRPESIQLDISARLLELGKLVGVADSLLRKGDEAGAAKAKGKADAFRSALETDARSEAGYDFEFQRVVKGMSSSVHVPDCIGSQLGHMHTHPDSDDKTVFFSHADVAHAFYKALTEGQSISIVSNYTDSMLLMATEKLHKEWSVLPDGAGASERAVDKEYREILHTIMAVVEAAQSRDEIAGLYATYLREKGLVLYRGVGPLLKKVEPISQYGNDYIKIVSGRLMPNRTLRSSLFAQAKYMVRVTPTFADSKYDVELNKIRDTIYDFNDASYLAALGLDRSETMIQHLADNDVDEYDLGACIRRGDRWIEYFPKCFGKSDFTRRRVRCSEIDPSNPGVYWVLEGEEDAPYASVIFRSDEDKGLCQALAYKMNANGFLEGEPKKWTFADQYAKPE